MLCENERANSGRLSGWLVRPQSGSSRHQTFIEILLHPTVLRPTASCLTQAHVRPWSSCGTSSAGHGMRVSFVRRDVQSKSMGSIPVPKQWTAYVV